MAKKKDGYFAHLGLKKNWRYVKNEEYTLEELVDIVFPDKIVLGNLGMKISFFRLAAIFSKKTLMRKIVNAIQKDLDEALLIAKKHSVRSLKYKIDRDD